MLAIPLYFFLFTGIFGRDRFAGDCIHRQTFSFNGLRLWLPTTATHLKKNRRFLHKFSVLGRAEENDVYSHNHGAPAHSGKRRYVKAVFSKGRPQLPAGYPDAQFHLRYRLHGKRCWQYVGSDPNHALVAKINRDRELSLAALTAEQPAQAKPTTAQHTFAEAAAKVPRPNQHHPRQEDLPEPEVHAGRVPEGESGEISGGRDPRRRGASADIGRSYRTPAESQVDRQSAVRSRN